MIIFFVLSNTKLIPISTNGYKKKKKLFVFKDTVRFYGYVYTHTHMNSGRIVFFLMDINAEYFV